jgi:hypothetical protein
MRIAKVATALLEQPPVTLGIIALLKPDGMCRLHDASGLTAIVETPMMPRTWLLVSEITKRLDLPRTTVGKWILKGLRLGGTILKLKAERVGGRIRVESASVDGFLAACSPDRPTVTGAKL